MPYSICSTSEARLPASTPRLSRLHEEQAHRGGAHAGAGDRAELDPQEEIVVRHGGHRDERDDPDEPRHHRLPVPESEMSACDNVSARMNSPLPEREERDVGVAEIELGAEQDPARERSDHPPTSTPNAPIPTTMQHQLAHTVLELVVAAGAHERRELRQQRRLHRLEQHDRDARQEQPHREVGDRGALTGALASTCAPMNGA